MKKLSIVALISIVILQTSCLKDKGFDNQEYGINFPGAVSGKGVGFNLEGGSSNFKTAGINAQTTPQQVDPSVMTLALYASSTVAEEDVHVHVAYDPTLIDDYNTANGTQIVPLDPSVYTIQTLDPVIAKGTQNTTLDVSVNSTATLDPITVYGVAFRITSVDAGYTIAENMKTIIVQILIKNRFDGVYEVKGTALRIVNGAPDAALSGPITPYEADYSTSGANSVQHEGSFHWGNWTTAGGSSLPGGYEPNIEFDPTTLNVVSVSSLNGAISGQTGTSYNQYYDPATKKMYYEFTWGAGPTARLMTIEATYLRAR
jgi:hypothetical protein